MKCIYIKSDGQRCKSYTMINSQYCWVHSPQISDGQKQEAYSKGGKANSHSAVNGLPLDLPPIIINSSADIPPLLIDTIGRLRQGTMHVRVAAALGYLSHILLRSYEIADLEPRVKALEAKAKDNEYTEFIYEDENN
jgi:hypothetical protein